MTTRKKVNYVEISTAHKVSVGLLTVTAAFVLVSAIAALVYTLGTNLTKSAPVIVSQPNTNTAPAPTADATGDRVLKITP